VAQGWAFAPALPAAALADWLRGPGVAWCGTAGSTAPSAA